MEKVHKAHLRAHISKQVNVTEYLNEWLQALSEEPQTPSLSSPSTSSAQHVQKSSRVDFMQKIPNELVSELCQLCSIKNLHCKDEPLAYPYPKREDAIAPKRGHNFISVPIEVNLTCLKFQKQKLINRWQEGSNWRQNMRRNSKCRDFNSKLRNSYAGHVSSSLEDDVSMPEVILNIVFYRPFHRTDPSQTRKTKQHSPLVEQRFTVLGCQTLTEVRDTFLCGADLTLPGEFSENPELAQQDISPAKDMYKGGFFYIGGIFYNDMRDPKSVDYSKVITDWAASDPKRGIGPFQSKRMEETTFAELEIKLGYPYVYQHQGNCEHLIMFTDLRLVTVSDCLDRGLYPLYIGFSRRMQNMCMICKTLPSKWVTEHNTRLPHETYFFCKNCFQNFNYTIDGKKIGEFDAYPYFDKLAVL